MNGYRARLRRDLDRWVERGLVPADSRAAILADVGAPARIGAATALAMLGALLLGVAVIAFVAANWAAIPRLARFGLLLAAFWAGAGTAAWAAQRGRPNLRNAALLVASLVYAAAIGLTGQIFDLAGEPHAALRGAGIGALVLALAGRSSAAAAAGLLLLALGDFAVPGDVRPGWTGAAGLMAMGLAWLWRSRPLAHAAALAVLVGGFLLGIEPAWAGWLAIAAVLAGGLAGLRRWAGDHPVGPALYGWAAAGVLVFFGAAGFGFDGEVGAKLAFRSGLLVLGVAAVGLGRHDRALGVWLSGALATAVAVAAILSDLGFGLMAAAGVFAAAAGFALAGGWLLKRRGG